MTTLIKKIPLSFFVLLTFILSLACKERPREDKTGTKVCSFNIRFDNPGDGFNRWENRRGNVVAFLAIEKPDIIGLQEVLANQLKYIEEGLSDYSRVGVGREDGVNKGEFTPILYRNDRYTLLDSGNFWLSETPEVPSLGWDAMIRRICTYVILKDNESEEEIHMYNTHFSHVGTEARLRSAALIMDSITVKSRDKRVILTGDFNTVPESSPYNKIIESGLSDSYDSDLRLGPAGTFNGFNLTGSFDRRIDFIFHRGFTVEYYVANSIAIDNQYLSDHFPVIALMNCQESFLLPQ